LEPGGESAFPREAGILERRIGDVKLEPAQYWVVLAHAASNSLLWGKSTSPAISSSVQNVIGKPCLRCWSNAQGLVNPSEIVEHRMKSYGMAQVLDLF